MNLHTESRTSLAFKYVASLEGPVINTGWAKSQFTYVGLNSTVTECSFEIILSGMTYYHHWFEEFVKSKHICVHFFQMKVHFCIYLIVWIAGSSQILLDCVWPFELSFF